MSADALRHLAGYPPDLLAQVQAVIDRGPGELAALVAQRHPEAHTVRSERALVD